MIFYCLRVVWLVASGYILLGSCRLIPAIVSIPSNKGTDHHLPGLNHLDFEGSSSDRLLNHPAWLPANNAALSRVRNLHTCISSAATCVPVSLLYHAPPRAHGCMPDQPFKGMCMRTRPGDIDRRMQRCKQVSLELDASGMHSDDMRLLRLGKFRVRGNRAGVVFSYQENDWRLVCMGSTCPVMINLSIASKPQWTSLVAFMINVPFDPDVALNANGNKQSLLRHSQRKRLGRELHRDDQRS